MRPSSTPTLPDLHVLQILNTLWTDHGAWPEFAEAMQRSILPEDPSGTPSSQAPQPAWSQLPALCCEAVGGNPETAGPVSLAWGLLYTAAHLMDSVADQDELPAWMVEAGPGSTINIATGLYASSILVLNNLLEEGVKLSTIIGIQNSFNRSILQMCSGQHLDLDVSTQPLEACWRIAQAKSGTIFELACKTGAQLGTEDQGVISTFGEFGRHLGMMVQICDDVAEIWSSRESTVRKFDPSSLPVVYTLEMLSEEKRERFRGYVDTPSSADMAIKMVEEAGTRLYMQTKLQYHYQGALIALRAADVPPPIYERLVGYVDRMVLSV
jgi:geranylgeranyl diphosphate synthase type I